MSASRLHVLLVGSTLAAGAFPPEAEAPPSEAPSPGTAPAVPVGAAETGAAEPRPAGAAIASGADAPSDAASDLPRDAAFATLRADPSIAVRRVADLGAARALLREAAPGDEAAAFDVLAAVAGPVDGPELARGLRSLAREAAERGALEPCVVILGAPATPGLAAEALRAGADEVVPWSAGPLRGGASPRGSSDRRSAPLPGDRLLGHALGQVRFRVDVAGQLRGHEERLRHAVRHDDLTGLVNRVRLLEHAGRALERGAAALLFIDIDRFKVLNVALGHPTGDRVLRTVAQRIREAVPEDALVARLGGDEFVVLLPGGHAAPRRVSRLARRLVEAVRRPVVLPGGADAVLTASIGVARSAALPATGPEPLLRAADLAMAAVKRAGGDGYRVFDHEMQHRARREMEMEQGLRRALEGAGLELLVQPIVSLAAPRPWGFEALVRWRDEAGRLRGPQEFLPLAERTGLIVPIGRWVLRRACRWAATAEGDPVVTVNLSVRQLAEPGFPDEVSAALAESGLPPSRLYLEVTESMLADEPAVATAALAVLRERGVGILLDDFGTGYSSLSQLLTYPIDGLKIDKSFLERLDDQPRFLEVIRAVLQMAGALDMEVIVEGVETRAQRRLVESLDSELAQGHLFARPMGLLDGTAYLRASAPSS